MKMILQATGKVVKTESLKSSLVINQGEPAKNSGLGLDSVRQLRNSVERSKT